MIIGEKEATALCEETLKGTRETEGTIFEVKEMTVAIGAMTILAKGEKNREMPKESDEITIQAQETKAEICERPPLEAADLSTKGSVGMTVIATEGETNEKTILGTGEDKQLGHFCF
jgi:hypothetical protein